MKRGDAAVLSVTVVLAVVAAAAVAFSLVVLDRRPQAAPASTSSLLVVTWAPSLCTVEPSNSGCRSGHVETLGKSFVLHGLWPQPATEQYCNVPERTPDRARNPVQLPDDLKSELKAMMSDSTLMTTHEWYAHGTCSGVTPPEYFSTATALATEANAVLNPLFAQAAGRALSSSSIRDAFDARFGKGAGSRVGMVCKDANGQGTVAYEVRLSLPPVTRLRSESPTLAEALAAGPAIPPGCGKSRVP